MYPHVLPHDIRERLSMIYLCSSGCRSYESEDLVTVEVTRWEGRFLFCTKRTWTKIRTERTKIRTKWTFYFSYFSENLQLVYLLIITEQSKSDTAIMDCRLFVKIYI